MAAARRRLTDHPHPHPPAGGAVSAPGAATAAALPAPQPWRILRLRQCTSTETELDRLLQAGARAPLVVLADRQSRGHGQQGRPWSSPRGGLWLSAALPWPGGDGTTAALGLAVAVAVARELEALGLAVHIKWPNDLLIGNRKLAGLLPRLRRRGTRIVLARVGLGLNGWNRVPPGATGLAEALAARPARQLSTAGARCLADPLPLAARVLRALDWACAQADQPERVRTEAQARLWRPSGGITHEGALWQVQGLGCDGSLLIGRGGTQKALHRHF